MFLSKYLLLLLAYLGLAAANNAEALAPQQRKSWVIINQLEILKSHTQWLGRIVDHWDGTLAGVLPVSDQTSTVIEATKHATIDIQENSKRLGIFGALHVKRVTNTLINDVKETTTKMANCRQAFNNVGIAETVLNNIVQQQAACQAMIDAIIPKLPHIARGIGRSLGRKISYELQVTIDLYREMLLKPSYRGTDDKSLSSTDTEPEFGTEK